MNVWIKVLDMPELAAAFGKREFSLEFSGETLDEFLQALKALYGPVLWDGQGKWDQSIQMIINGRVYGIEGRPIFLKEGDRITFVVLLEGG
jgi:hypothetical protein